MWFIIGGFIMKKVAFVCVHNSCRSQMAEGWAKALGKGVIEAYSAGTEDYPQVNQVPYRLWKKRALTWVNIILNY